MDLEIKPNDSSEYLILISNVIMIDEQNGELVNLRIMARSVFELAKMFIRFTNKRISTKKVRKMCWEECKHNIKIKRFTLPSYIVYKIN